MAITVYVWPVVQDRVINDDGVITSPGTAYWEAVSPDQPDVNASTMHQVDPDGQQVRDILVAAFNRVNQPEPAATRDGFEFTSPPDGWRNPNEPAAEASA